MEIYTIKDNIKGVRSFTEFMFKLNGIMALIG